MNREEDSTAAFKMPEIPSRYVDPVSQKADHLTVALDVAKKFLPPERINGMLDEWIKSLKVETFDSLSTIPASRLATRATSEYGFNQHTTSKSGICLQGECKTGVRAGSRCGSIRSEFCRTGMSRPPAPSFSHQWDNVPRPIRDFKKPSVYESMIHANNDSSRQDRRPGEPIPSAHQTGFYNVREYDSMANNRPVVKEKVNTLKSTDGDDLLAIFSRKGEKDDRYVDVQQQAGNSKRISTKTSYSSAKTSSGAVNSATIRPGRKPENEQHTSKNQTGSTQQRNVRNGSRAPTTANLTIELRPRKPRPSLVVSKVRNASKTVTHKSDRGAATQKRKSPSYHQSNKRLKKQETNRSGRNLELFGDVSSIGDSSMLQDASTDKGVTTTSTKRVARNRRQELTLVLSPMSRQKRAFANGFSAISTPLPKSQDKKTLANRVVKRQMENRKLEMKNAAGPSSVARADEEEVWESNCSEFSDVSD